MNFRQFVSVLLSNDVNISIAQAYNIYDSLGIETLASKLASAVEENKRVAEYGEEQEPALARLRAQLKGTSHNYLVQEALHSTEVMRLLRRGRKIDALKELRLRTNCSLKEALEAVRDDRVSSAVVYDQ